MKKRILTIVLAGIMGLSLCACGAEKNTKTEESKTEEKKEDTQTEELTGTVTLAAAASLEKTFTEKLIPMFNETYPDVTVEGTYDSSGKLQTQIEEGAEVDVFFSAALKQMDALKEEGMIQEDSVEELLENKIVLITPAGSSADYQTFEDIAKAGMVAIGDPESVPAGQYGKEALENLGLWTEVEGKLSLGTNVTEVLNWVSAGSADAGIVYATDAASMTDTVTVIAEAPEGSVSKVIYPVGLVKDSKNQEAAKAFLEFLKSDEAMKVFEEAGFTDNR